MRNCFTRGDFNVNYNRILDAIERAANRKKNDEKGTKRGFATKEEADEYGGRKQARDFHHEPNGKEKNTKDEKAPDKRKNNFSNTSSESETNFSPTNDRKNEPVDDPTSSNEQILSKNKQKAGNNEDKTTVF